MFLIKRLLPLVIIVLLGLSAHCQQPAPTGNPVLTDEMVAKLIAFDVKRFTLTAEQTVQDKRVMSNYQVKSNELAQKNDLSVDELRKSVRGLRLELAAGYKSFLTPEQYSLFIATYNKMHPNDQLRQ